MPKLSAWMVYGGVFIAIIAVVALGYQAPQQLEPDATASANSVQVPEATPIVADGVSVDKVVATDIASNIAEQTNMSIASHVAEYSASLAVEVSLAQNDDTAIEKPHIVQPTDGSREIVLYTAKAGDTIKSIANAYGVSAETIRWANNLTTNSVTAGKKLRIPPVDGVLYTVKPGDTIDALAQRYGADKSRIISYNDLEISGLEKGMKIIIPGGNLPETQRPGYVAPITQPTIVNYGSGFGGSSWHIKVGSSGRPGNGYAFGYCTYYAYDRRVEMGLKVGGNWGNASSWSWYAQSEGYRVNNSPSVGAIIQNGGGLGHVGIVEDIKPNGDIVISEMNAYVSGGGWNVVSGRVIPKSQVGSYAYIH